jgi:hypothetical protein
MSFALCLSGFEYQTALGASKTSLSKDEAKNIEIVTFTPHLTTHFSVLPVKLGLPKLACMSIT